MVWIELSQLVVRKGAPELGAMGVVVKTNRIPFWLVGEFTTHFRLPILVGIG